MKLVLWARSALIIGLAWYACAMLAIGASLSLEALLGPSFLLVVLVLLSAAAAAGSLILAHRHARATTTAQLGIWYVATILCSTLTGSATQSWIPLVIGLPTALVTALILLRQGEHRAETQSPAP